MEEEDDGCMVDTLDTKTRQVYEALIRAGATTAADIATRSGLKRPTAYLHLETLIKAGLAERVAHNKRTYFKARNPKPLYDQLAKEKTELDALSTVFASMSDRFGKPKVRFIEGRPAIVELYREIAGSFGIRAWFSIESRPPTLFEEVNMDFPRIVREHKTGFKDIVANNKKTIAHAEKMRRLIGPTYQFRVANEGAIENDTLIYDNCVAILRLHETDLYAVRIEDRSIANTFRVIFDMTWDSLKGKRVG